MSTPEDLPAPPLCRIHIKTATDDRAGAFQWLLEHGLVAVGWSAKEHGRTGMSWEEYEAGAAQVYGKVNQNVRALRKLPDGTLVWTRNTKGEYYLGRIDGPWRYLNEPENVRLCLHNARPARLLRCGVEALVPGTVVNFFSRGTTVQNITDEAARRYSASLYAQLAGERYDWAPTLQQVLGSCLGAKDLEDLVAVYLQRARGYVVLPGSRRPDTPAYEYVLKHPDGRTAVVQVKGGKATVPRDSSSLPVGSVDDIYVFQPHGHYGPDPAHNVHTIEFDELAAFIREEPWCLPPMVENWATRIRPG